MTRQPLAGITVLEAGDRLAVTACGSVLAAFGAEVSVTRSGFDRGARYPAVHTDGKRVVSGNVAEALCARADVVLLSSDVSPYSTEPRSPEQICCDITAYGASGPMAGRAHADPLLQAVTGLADTTGEPDAPPALCTFPVTEGIAALYAAAGVLTALIARNRAGRGQGIEIALFDCAFSTLATFMPFHFVGKPVTRAGNRHVLASPWNIYRARDAWLVICTGSDEQWLRLCQVLGRVDLATDERLKRAQDRVLHRPIVDEAVQRWIERLDAASAAGALEKQGVAAGPVVAASDLEREPNMRHRGLYSDRGLQSAIRYFDPATGRTSAATTGSPDSPNRVTETHRPLAGLRVIELGQYTTAPFVARHLGALGADVLKIEPPGGDATRGWPPQQDGLGYFFSLSNSDKRSCCLDLRTKSDCARFAELLGSADVLVENLKPGSLTKLGFGDDRRAAINPRLVYCAISGFGADSAYPGRPAFDTVIQAMSGIMDSIRQNDRPQKAGISLADILGGLFGLTGTLSALLDRAASGAGDGLDISMQDAAAWITQWTAGTTQEDRVATLRCRDGYVAAMADARACGAADELALRSRAEVVETLSNRGIQAAPVLTIDEVARSDQARSRRNLVSVRDSANREWQVFNTPIRLSATPGEVRRAIGALGEADESIDWL